MRGKKNSNVRGRINEIKRRKREKKARRVIGMITTRKEIRLISRRKM